MRAYPHELSGGMRQRVMTALAVSSNPKLLIADEPTTALDVTVQAQVIGMLDSIRRELGIAVLFISHNLDLIAEICDRVSVMYAGKVVESSAVETVFEAPRHPYTRQFAALHPAPGCQHRADADDPRPAAALRHRSRRMSVRGALRPGARPVPDLRTADLAGAGSPRSLLGCRLMAKTEGFFRVAGDSARSTCCVAACCNA